MVHILPSLYLGWGRGIAKGEGVIIYLFIYLCACLYSPYKNSLVISGTNFGFFEVVVTKNRNLNRRQRVSGVIAQMQDDIGNNQSYVVVNANTDSWHVLQNRIASINQKRMSYDTVGEVIEIYQAHIKVLSNMEDIEKMFGVMGYIQEGRYGSFNQLIDCVNDFIDHNAFMRLKYKKLEPVTLDGIMQIGKKGDVLTEPEEPTPMVLTSSKEEKIAIKEVFN